jgi:hypothetical protein
MSSLEPCHNVPFSAGYATFLKTKRFEMTAVPAIMLALRKKDEELHLDFRNAQEVNVRLDTDDSFEGCRLRRQLRKTAEFVGPRRASCAFLGAKRTGIAYTIEI